MEQGKLTGPKPPLRPEQVWLIRTKLQIEGRVRDLAMFYFAIDRKLRGCDVVAMRVEDVAAGGTRQIVQRFDKRKLVGQSDLNRANKPARRSMTI